MNNGEGNNNQPAVGDPLIPTARPDVGVSNPSGGSLGNPVAEAANQAAAEAPTTSPLQDPVNPRQEQFIDTFLTPGSATPPPAPESDSAAAGSASDLMGKALAGLDSTTPPTASESSASIPADTQALTETPVPTVPAEDPMSPAAEGTKEPEKMSDPREEFINTVRTAFDTTLDKLKKEEEIRTNF